METFFAQFFAFLAGVFALAQSGFDGVNQVVGLIIALLSALLMPAWRALWVTAAGATVAHLVVGVMRPVLDGGAFVLPEIMAVGFWMAALGLFLGYAVVIAVFFFIKTLLPGLAPKKAKPAH